MRRQINFNISIRTLLEVQSQTKPVGAYQQNMRIDPKHSPNSVLEFEGRLSANSKAVWDAYFPRDEWAPRSQVD